MRPSRITALAALFALTACQGTGDLGQPCNLDATCNSPRLECRHESTLIVGKEWFCVPVSKETM